MFADLMASRELAWRLIVRDIKARYRQAFLGFVWAFLPPVATTLVFVFLNRNGIISVGDTDIPYPAFVMIGTLLWQLFADSLTAPLTMITGSKSMLTRINFPREALILAGIGQTLFDFTVRLLLFAAVVAYFRLSLPLTALLAPLGILAIIGLGLMIGILITPLGVLYTDISRSLPILTGFWMLLTPVVYPPANEGVLGFLARYNPISPLIVTTRAWLTSGASDYLAPFLLVAVLTLVLLMLGWLIFRISLPHLISRIGT